jgi:SAM-dependent methyltransferase
MLAPTARFSTRVEDYVKYRPDYPVAVLDWLRAKCGLTPAAVVADVGSGTGKLAELFLRNGNRVFGVEPNREMREAGERLLAGFPNFVSVDGAAEATTLPGASADFVIAGQSFHWFDPGPTRREFARILRPGGWVVVVWNARAMTSPFQQAYEQLLLEFCPEYTQVNHRDVGEEDLRSWLGLAPFLKASFANGQSFDFDGLAGRLLSSSYAPEPGHPNHEPMMTSLATLFSRFQAGGLVEFDYETQVYCGQMG